MVEKLLKEDRSSRQFRHGWTSDVDIRISLVVSIGVQISKVQFVTFFVFIYHVAAFNDIEAFNEDYIVS